MILTKKNKLIMNIKINKQKFNLMKFLSNIKNNLFNYIYFFAF